MAVDDQRWWRQGEAYSRAHHEAWRRSDLNQRQYCEAQDILLKAFGNWRAKFKAEPQPPARKLLYRRGGLSHPLVRPGPIVPRQRDGYRRRFSKATSAGSSKKRRATCVSRRGAYAMRLAAPHRPIKALGSRPVIERWDQMTPPDS